MAPQAMNRVMTHILRLIANPPPECIVDFFLYTQVHSVEPLSTLISLSSLSLTRYSVERTFFLRVVLAGRIRLNINLSQVSLFLREHTRARTRGHVHMHMQTKQSDASENLHISFTPRVMDHPGAGTSRHFCYNFLASLPSKLREL